MSNDEAEQILERHLASLMEHFDSVRVIVSKHDSETNGTKMHSYGAGNFFAQLGSVGAWLEAQELAMAPEEDEE